MGGRGIRRGNGREGVERKGEGWEGEEGKPTRASNSKTAYGYMIRYNNITQENIMYPVSEV